MANKRDEIVEYMKSCMKHDIPLNNVTYTWYRFTKGIMLKELITEIKRKIICGLK